MIGKLFTHDGVVDYIEENETERERSPPSNAVSFHMTVEENTLGFRLRNFISLNCNHGVWLGLG